MNFGNEIISTDNHREKNNNPDIKILEEQLKEAIAEEDYEQAAILRDLIGSGFDLDSLEIKSGTNTPGSRALEGIKEKKQEKFFEGKEVVEASELFCFLETLRKGDKNDKKVQDALKRLAYDSEEAKEFEQIDRFVNLRNYQEEAIKLVNLSQEKFNSIWQPYREKANLVDAQYDEYQTSYKNSGSTVEQWKKIREVPEDLVKPLRYWQSVYDNSRIILDTLNEALSKMEGKHLGY